MRDKHCEKCTEIHKAYQQDKQDETKEKLKEIENKVIQNNYDKD